MDSVCLNLETIVQTQDVISANSTSKSDSKWVVTIQEGQMMRRKKHSSIKVSLIT